MIKRLTCKFFEFNFISFPRFPLHFRCLSVSKIVFYPNQWYGILISIDSKRLASMISLLNTRNSVKNIRYKKSDLTHHSVLELLPYLFIWYSASRGWAITDTDTNAKISSKFACVRRQELLWCFNERFSDRCRIVVIIVLNIILITHNLI